MTNFVVCCFGRFVFTSSLTFHVHPALLKDFLLGWHIYKFLSNGFGNAAHAKFGRYCMKSGAQLGGYMHTCAFYQLHKKKLPNNGNMWEAKKSMQILSNVDVLGTADSGAGV